MVEIFPQDTKAEEKPVEKKVVKNSSDDLLDIQVHNPLHKIIKILEDIKNHQSTTFSLHLTIPLIALPIFIAVLFGVFQMGKIQATCLPSFTSRIGVIKTIGVEVPKSNTGFFAQFLPFLPGVSAASAKSYTKATRFLLISDTTLEPIQVIKNIPLTMSSFENTQVILSGTYSSCTNTITLDSTKNIELLK